MTLQPQTEFERFALDHYAHAHCHGCGGCLLDPSHLIQGFIPVYCVGCRDRIKANNKPGVPLPWVGGYEFNPTRYVPRAAPHNESGEGKP